MNDNDNFLNLREKWRNDTATTEEVTEYFNLLKSGKFAELDDEETKIIWDAAETLLSSEEKDNRERLYERVKKYIQKSK